MGGRQPGNAAADHGDTLFFDSLGIAHGCPLNRVPCLFSFGNAF